MRFYNFRGLNGSTSGGGQTPPVTWDSFGGNLIGFWVPDSNKMTFNGYQILSWEPTASGVSTSTLYGQNRTSAQLLNGELTISTASRMFNNTPPSRVDASVVTTFIAFKGIAPVTDLTLNTNPFYVLSYGNTYGIDFKCTTANSPYRMYQNSNDLSATFTKTDTNCVVNQLTSTVNGVNYIELGGYYNNITQSCAIYAMCIISRAITADEKTFVKSQIALYCTPTYYDTTF